MKRFIKLMLLSSSSVLFSACNPTTEFATFDPANAKDKKEEKLRGLERAAENPKAAIHVDYVINTNANENGNSTIEDKKIEVTEMVKKVVVGSPDKDIHIHFYPANASEQSIEFRQVLSTETLTAIDEIYDVVGQDDNTYTTTIHESDLVVVVIVDNADIDEINDSNVGEVDSNNICSENSSSTSKKIDVCHQTPNHSQDIRVSANAIAAFTAQGDFIGTCALRDLVNTCADQEVDLTTMTCKNAGDPEEVINDDAICSATSSKEKIDICHKTSNHWQDINVSVNAIAAHSAHGDFIGTCAFKDLVTTCAGRTVNLTTMTCQ